MRVLLNAVGPYNDVWKERCFDMDISLVEMWP